MLYRKLQRYAEAILRKSQNFRAQPSANLRKVGIYVYFYYRHDVPRKEAMYGGMKWGMIAGESQNNQATQYCVGEMIFYQRYKNVCGNGRI